MPGSLLAHEVTQLNSGVIAADANYIRGVLGSVVGRQPMSWLSTTHPHQNGTLPKTEADFQAVPPHFVIESVAARGPLHCLDGWSYLARSIGALLAGTTHSSRHLAYYAELRGALSILASEGIGVFNSRNRAVTNAGTLLPLPNRGTHEMAWFALKNWAGQSRALARILGAIEINGVTLFDAFQTFFPSPAVTALSSDLISKWGFDLDIGVIDRDERNISSYSPNDLTSIPHTASDDLEFIASLWGFFQPGAWTLEAELLRMLLDVQQAAVGGRPISDMQDRYDELDPRISSVVPFEFLTRIVCPHDHPVIVEAKVSARPSEPRAMIARSALLLRIATGMARVNLTAATIQPFDQLEDWWAKIGDQKGLWRPMQRPTTMDDLWTEIEDALEAARTKAPASRYDLLSQRDVSLVKLSEAERIGLWHLCR